MRGLLIIVTVLLYSCSSKNQNEKKLKSSIDFSAVVIDTSTYDAGFSELGEASENIQYNSILSRNCTYQNLSKNFDIKALFNRYISIAETRDSFSVKLILIDKTSKVSFDSIELYSYYYYQTVFKDCKNVMSYITKFNIKKDIVDNNYGDIIVADFNFDNKEDIAVINDSGGNAGPLYSFFIQSKDRKFIKDAYLTESLEFFPSEINKNKKTLTTYVHAGVCGLGEHIYTFDVNKNCWKEESHHIINICK